jgi:putative membrane protein
MELVLLLLKTIAFRPYVFAFLAAFLFAAIKLIGWPRTWRFWVISWATAFVCEFSSTRTGIPFGWYHYNGSTVGQELYFFDVPFMDSISFSFLLYAAFLFAFIDMVIDPVALRGDRWFLGKIYYYPDPGVHFGVPFANYVGWAIVGLLSLAIYFPLERRLPDLLPPPSITLLILLGVGLYYGVLAFNLSVTFWIGESFMGMSGLLMHLPVIVLLIVRLTGMRRVAPSG